MFPNYKPFSNLRGKPTMKKPFSKCWSQVLNTGDFNWRGFYWGGYWGMNSHLPNLKHEPWEWDTLTHTLQHAQSTPDNNHPQPQDPSLPRFHHTTTSIPIIHLFCCVWLPLVQVMDWFLFYFIWNQIYHLNCEFQGLVGLWC